VAGMLNNLKSTTTLSRPSEPVDFRNLGLTVGSWLEYPLEIESMEGAMLVDMKGLSGKARIVSISANEIVVDTGSPDYAACGVKLCP
jgi:hypothetical protein